MGSPPALWITKRWTRLAAESGKVYQLLAHGRRFSPGTPASSTTKTGVQHDFHSRWCSFVVCMRVHLFFTLFVFTCVKWCQFLWIDHFLIASSVFYNVNSCRLIIVRCVLHVEKKFTPVFSGVRVARTLLFCVMFYGLLFLVVFFSFSYYIFYHSSIYGVHNPLGKIYAKLE